MPMAESAFHRIQNSQDPPFHGGISCPGTALLSTPERCLGLDEDDFMINATMFNDMIILDPCSTPKLGFVALHIYI